MFIILIPHFWKVELKNKKGGKIMKTILTASELEQVGIALGSLVGKDYPFKISYALAKLTKEIEKELKILTEIRQKLVKAHALHNESDQPIVIEDSVTKQKMTFQKGQPITAIDPLTKQQIYTYKDDETKKSYLKELGDLMKMNIEIEHLTLSFDILDKVNFSPIQLKTLIFMVDGESSDKKGIHK